MACPVCDHTMEGIAGAYRVFWCPRCGTMKDCGQREAAGLPDEVEEGGDALGIAKPKLTGLSFALIHGVLARGETIEPGLANYLYPLIRDVDKCIGGTIP